MLSGSSGGSSSPAHPARNLEYIGTPYGNCRSANTVNFQNTILEYVCELSITITPTYGRGLGGAGAGLGPTQVSGGTVVLEGLLDVLDEKELRKDSHQSKLKSYYSGE